MWLASPHPDGSHDAGQVGHAVEQGLHGRRVSPHPDLRDQQHGARIVLFRNGQADAFIEESAAAAHRREQLVRDGVEHHPDHHLNKAAIFSLPSIATRRSRAKVAQTSRNQRAHGGSLDWQPPRLGVPIDVSGVQWQSKRGGL